MDLIEAPSYSRYIRTTCMLSARTTLEIEGFGRIRFFDGLEAERLAELVRKRNVFARHSQERNFYFRRARELANHTVIEIFRPGDPRGMSDEAEKMSAFIERLAVLSSVLLFSRLRLHRQLGVRAKLGAETVFIVGPNMRYLSSKARPSPIVQGLDIDEAFRKRFQRFGFPTLATYGLGNVGVPDRVVSTLDWLFDSRLDPRLHSSVAKTATALESLLIFSESEALARALSERAAFILSSDPVRRAQISRIIKNFYEARSGVVHGSKKKLKKLTPHLIEAVDRVALLLCLTIAANSELWSSAELLREWCEQERWGAPSTKVVIPFPIHYLAKTVALAEEDTPLDQHKC